MYIYIRLYGKGMYVFIVQIPIAGATVDLVVEGTSHVVVTFHAEGEDGMQMYS